MESIAYYNGVFDTRNNIRIPLTDRGLYFGDGVYDAAIGKNGKIFLKDEHITRFLSNANKLSLPHPSYREVYTVLDEAVSRFEGNEFFIYFQLTAKCDSRRHSMLESKEYNLLITVDEFSLKSNKEQLSLITCEDLRYQYCDIKTLNLLPSVMAATNADAAGCDEAVFHRGKTVTECSHSNIFIFKRDTLYTHPTTNLILPGITRKHVLKAAEALGIIYRERAFSLDELYSADEILISSTTKLCKRANLINGISVAGKSASVAESICKFLHDEYANF